MNDFLSTPQGDDEAFDLDAELNSLGMTMDEVDAAIEEIESDLSADLHAVWDVPADLSERISRKAWRKIQDRQSLTTFGGLFGLGWQATKAVIDPVEEAE